MTIDDQIRELNKRINSLRNTDQQFFDDFQDYDKQMQEENSHLSIVMNILNLIVEKFTGRKVEGLQSKLDLLDGPGYDKYSMDEAVRATNKIIKEIVNIENYGPFSKQPYVARIDTYDDNEDGGYNSYYIGKHADQDMEISSWKSPIAEPYFTHEQYESPINGIDYKLILLRLIGLSGDKVESLADQGPFTDYLPIELKNGISVASKLIFDAYLDKVLKETLESRKEKTGIVDIIWTIRDTQYKIISLPASSHFVCQGVAGSGKTMVLLHRLAYVVYNNIDIQSANVLVISPSNSYNEFVKDISEDLEIDNLQTSTIDSYFMSVLKNAGMDFTDKMNSSVSPKRVYLEYLYSKSFVQDVTDYIGKTYGGIISAIYNQKNGLIIKILEACTQQNGAYKKIKNSSIRIQNAVLGEISEGSHYSKPFAGMIDSIMDVLEFSSLVSIDEVKNYSCASFTERFSSFYKAICYLESSSRNVCKAALSDLVMLKNNVQGELLDDQKKSSMDEKQYIAYAGRLNNLIREIDSVSALVQKISEELAPTLEFGSILHNVESLDDIGKCKKAKDVIEYFNKSFVLPKKREHKVKTTAFMKCDLFTFTYFLAELEYDLTPKYAYLFIDEAQDISLPEYRLLRNLNKNAVFNIYGDLMQNITPFRGIKSWDSFGFDVYNLDINYRNTNEIVNFVSDELHTDMKPVGVKGNPVMTLSVNDAAAYLSQRKGLKAIICSEESLHAFKNASYNLLRKTNKVDKDKINVMTVYESKGLEFSAVVVCDNDLSANEKYVAYTRALSELIVVHDKV